jgi:hypothetical protein
VIAVRRARAAGGLRDRRDRPGRREPACTFRPLRDRAVTAVTAMIAVIAVIAGIVSSGPVRTRRSGRGPSLDVEKKLEFDWDMKVRISERACTALEFMRTAMERYCDAGQPLWPVVPSSMYGAFLAGEAREARILVVTFDASVDGWGAVVRSSPEEKGTEIAGGYRLAAPMLWRAFVDPRSLHVQPRRCIGRRWRASSPRELLASCTLWQIVPS